MCLVRGVSALGGVWSQAVFAPRGVPVWVVSALVGLLWEGLWFGGCLVWRGVWSGGMSGPGGVWSLEVWFLGVSAPGVYVPRGGVSGLGGSASVHAGIPHPPPQDQTPPSEQNSGHTPMKILPCLKLRLRAVKKSVNRFTLMES